MTTESLTVQFTASLNCMATSGTIRCRLRRGAPNEVSVTHHQCGCVVPDSNSRRFSEEPKDVKQQCVTFLSAVAE